MPNPVYIKLCSDYWKVDLESGGIKAASKPLFSNNELIDLSPDVDDSEEREQIKKNRDLKPFERRQQLRELNLEKRARREDFQELLTSQGRIQLEAERVKDLADTFFEKVKQAFDSTSVEYQKRSILFFATRIVRQQRGFAENLKAAFGEEAKKIFANRLQERSTALAKDHIIIRVGQGYYSYNTETQKIGDFQLWADAPPFDPTQVQIIELNTRENRDQMMALTMFFERGRGEKFIVKKGVFKTITSKRELLYLKRHKAELEQSIQGVATRAFQALNAQLEALKLEGGNKKAVETLLRVKVQKNSPLARLKKTLFNRGEAIPCCSVLESYLDQKVVEKHNFLLAAFTNQREHRKNLNGVGKTARIKGKHALQERINAEINLDLTLGIKLKKISAGGSGGARLAYNRYGVPIAVVKPDDEGPYGINNPTWSSWFKRKFISQRACIAGNFECITETGACLLDAQMSTNLVPSTSTEFVNSSCFINAHEKICSVQAFVGGAEEFAKLTHIPWHVSLTEKIKSFFQSIQAFLFWPPKDSFDKEPVTHWFVVRQREIETRIIEGKGDDYQFTEQELSELETLSFLHGRHCLEKGFKVEDYKKACEDFAQKVQLLGAFDFLAGDTDCHDENFMVTQKRVIHPTIRALFDLDKHTPDPTDEELQYLAAHLFDPRAVKKGEPLLFAQLMHAYLEGEDGETILVKHDGGSSLPHSHPTTAFQMRNAYKFARLPFMTKEFSEKTKAFVQNSDDSVIESMMLLGAQNLLNICSAEELKGFWAKVENRVLFKRWILLGDKGDEFAMRDAILETYNERIRKAKQNCDASDGEDKKAAKAVLDKKLYEKSQREKNLVRHLPRIRGIVKTMQTRWELLLAHVTDFRVSESQAVASERGTAEHFYTDPNMRKLFSLKLASDILSAHNYALAIPEKRERLNKFRDKISLVAKQQLVSEQSFELDEDVDFYTLQNFARQLLEMMRPQEEDSCL